MRGPSRHSGRAPWEVLPDLDGPEEQECCVCAYTLPHSASLDFHRPVTHQEYVVQLDFLVQGDLGYDGLDYEDIPDVKSDELWSDGDPYGGQVLSVEGGWEMERHSVTQRLNVCTESGGGDDRIKAVSAWKRVGVRQAEKLAEEFSS
ncbi:hypothetical protein L6452_03185 [Arctium lappa]|uniref:Uncharacterized protein n=1 Tax=Arctium lappa TaxID=4217 RepID=A0ACB9FM19_ARCLA|nr:hypothetical protein L6452_03185 [Arctium lappa]